jgi:hypothetical protein
MGIQALRVVQTTALRRPFPRRLRNLETHDEKADASIICRANDGHGVKQWSPSGSSGPQESITDQEAEEVWAELLEDHSATSDGKWNFSQPVTRINLYGDVRARYAIQEGPSGGAFANLNWAIAARAVGSDPACILGWNCILRTTRCSALCKERRTTPSRATRTIQHTKTP